MTFIKHKASHKTACLIAQHGENYMHIACILPAYFCVKHTGDNNASENSRTRTNQSIADNQKTGK